MPTRRSTSLLSAQQAPEKNTPITSANRQFIHYRSQAPRERRGFLVLDAKTEGMAQMLELHSDVATLMPVSSALACVKRRERSNPQSAGRKGGARDQVWRFAEACSGRTKARFGMFLNHMPWEP
jgi:hypothetical protein